MGKIVYPDLSQIEYRLIAHETNEPKLIRIFRAGGDIHDETVKDLTGHYPKDKAERKPYKTLNYAEIYGVGLAKLAYLAELTYKEARALKAKIKGRYPMVDDYKADLADRFMDEDVVKVSNIFGRHRFMSLSEFYGNNDQERCRNAIREAFNYIFQSSAHDILKVWLMETMDQIDDPQVLLINDVHDEFVLDVPDKKVKRVLEAVKYTSDNLNELIFEVFGVHIRVPLLAEIEIGRSWK